MKVIREALLNQLELLRPGLSNKEIIEQSSCFVFTKKGRVYTYNDEIACSSKVDLKIEGAVPSIPLINLLDKLKEDELEIFLAKGELIVKGKNKKAGIKIEQKILLPIEEIESPQQWRPLHKNFKEAVEIVLSCASKDASTAVLTCVHLHQKYTEACDRYQLARCKLKTGLKHELLIRADTLSFVCEMEPLEYSETKSWLHFRNKTGLVLSCRMNQEEYPSLDDHLKVNGIETVLPKSLGEAVEKAEIFSVENKENNQVLVSLFSNKITLRGEGKFGWFSETKKAEYDGPKMSFRIPPKMLFNLIRQHNKCKMSDKAICIDTGVYRYVTCLSAEDSSP